MHRAPTKNHLIAAILVTLLVAAFATSAQPFDGIGDLALGYLKNVVIFGAFFFLIGIASVRWLEGRGHLSRQAFLVLGGVWGLVFLGLTIAWIVLRACLGSGCAPVGLEGVLFSPPMLLLAVLMVIAFAVLAYLYRAIAYREI